MHAVWQDLGDPNTLIYLLSYKNRAAREAGWAVFNADPKMDGITNEAFCAADDQGLHDERDRLLAAQVTDPSAAATSGVRTKRLVRRRLSAGYRGL